MMDTSRRNSGIVTLGLILFAFLVVFGGLFSVVAWYALRHY